jgi:hypothetical protein
MSCAMPCWETHLVGSGRRGELDAPGPLPVRCPHRGVQRPISNHFAAPRARMLAAGVPAPSRTRSPALTWWPAPLPAPSVQGLP